MVPSITANSTIDTVLPFTNYRHKFLNKNPQIRISVNYQDQTSASEGVGAQREGQCRRS